MSAWLKLFKDGEKEYGTDRDIAKGKASWSKGRLAEIKSVTITANATTAELRIPDTEWHQFDKLIAPIAPGSHKPIRTHRVVQAKVTAEHIGYSVIRVYDNTIFKYSLARLDSDVVAKTLVEKDIGSWVTLVLSQTNEPEIVIANRGQIKMKD